MRNKVVRPPKKKIFIGAALNEEEEQHSHTWLLLGTTSAFYCQTMSSFSGVVGG